MANTAADKKIVYYEFYPNLFKGWFGGKTSKRKSKRKSGLLKITVYLKQRSLPR